MKKNYLPILLLLLAPLLSFSQLTYLGVDLPDKKAEDGYRKDLQASNLIKHNGKFYFATPNSALYETDGTKLGTRMVYSNNAHYFTILASNEKYIYLPLGNKYSSNLCRIRPEDRVPKIQAIVSQSAERKGYSLLFDATKVPGNRNRVDALFTSPDQKEVFVRRFTGEKFYITKISDSLPDQTSDMMIGYLPTKEAPDMAIYHSTSIGFAPSRFYINGYERSLLDRKTPVAFTSVSMKKVPGSPLGYLLNDYHYTYDKGYTIYPGFLSANGELYSLLKKNAQPNKDDYMLMHYGSDKVTVPVALPSPDKYVSAEVHNEKIYFIRTGEILRYDKSQNKLITIFAKPEQQFLQINQGDYLVKTEGFIMTRNNKGLLLIEEKTGVSTALDEILLHKLRNNFYGDEIYVYGGGSNFFFVGKKKGEGYGLIRFDPVIKTYSEIELPVMKGLNFDQTQAVIQLGNRFIIIACYKDKRYTASYHMFMYSDEK